ncbi:TonB-dependent receptor [Sphingomonas sp. AOB5]|uniref:TonB-dependent receptor n=1 Tax=Sphingomonas sp. AOB5 TaxID=3034017 RepID=UPI0023F68D0E|nr:TonB-dependent receptor [Sphingomonas sp. AOB5]MDF7776636.1 TonB-dependent receptor [Sphingomonas sp. AOB5]
MRTKLFAGVAFAALILPSAAFAQSTGSTDFEAENEIVVTGTAVARSVGGVELPDSPKSKVVIDAELIGRQRPGQTVNEIINLVPGVSFQSNDATGSAGGTFTIRGFDSSRISQTVDGIPLNDTGNYAIYSNQQQDSETLASVNVNLGTTDVDSPTASAVGGTVNIRTRVPGDSLGGMVSAMYGNYITEGAGDRPIHRVFGMLDTGDFTGMGTKAFVSASWTNARQPFNNYGRIQKQQYNGRIYQEIGSNGDFVSVSGHYNENRNNFFGSVPLRTDASASRIVGPNSANRFPLTNAERFYNINYPCTIAPAVNNPAYAGGVGAAPANPTAGAACGAEFDRRYNPSNTGNIRGNSRFTLSDGLVLTIDPSFQYVKANGGGVVNASEAFGNLTGTRPAGSTTTGYVGILNTGPNTGNTGSPSGFGHYFGRDLNGDGDMTDTILLTNPSQTTTRRYVVISSLAYELNASNRVRLTYTYDRGRHRQTGEYGYVYVNGEPSDVFPVNNPILGADGTPVQKRDRLSYATLNQISGEYRGQFLNDSLTVVLGVRAPWFQRDLDQRCFTIAANGNVSCVAASQVAAYTAANPYIYIPAGQTTVGTTTRPASCGGTTVLTAGCVIGFAAPQKRTYKYDKILPNVGFTYAITDDLRFNFNFAQGLSVPSTDNLYNAMYYPVGDANATPLPETSDSFDAGLRYSSRGLQIQLAGWYTSFQNRIASVYDPETDQSLYRNLGDVEKYGVDASIAFKPVPDLLLYAFGSYLHSEIKDNLESGRYVNGSGTTVTNYFQTAGKREGGAPEWTFGGRIQGTLGPVDLGVQAKYTGSRFVNDENLPIYACVGTFVGGVCPVAGNGVPVTVGATQTQIYSAKIPAYTVVDLDLRFNMADYGLEKTYIQVNVSNLFDTLYVGGVSGSNGFVGVGNRYNIPNVVIGTPRSITVALVVGF